MSIGDSLLDYFSKTEIINNDMKYYKKKKFITVGFNNHPLLKQFDWLQITYKRKDKKYIIHSLDGVLSFDNNYKACLKKKKEIVHEVKNMLDMDSDDYGGNHSQDTSGKSVFKTSEWILDKDHLVVQCIDWSKEMEKLYFDHLKVLVATSEFHDWVQNNPY